MKKLKLYIASFVAMSSLAATPLILSTAVYADDSPASQIQSGVDQTGGSSNKTPLQDYIKTIVNTLLFLLGAIAVIMIIIGGIRYTTSNGDASQTKSAKDTILYAVVGLVVAILAYAIVNFVVTSFSQR